MFFDQPKTDAAYLALLLSIAQVQRELLNCHFDWEERIPRPVPMRRGLFGMRKAAEPQYEQLLEKRESLRQKALEHRSKMGYPSGTFWWNMPWDQIEPCLIYDLEQMELDGNWRFEQQWELIPLGGGSQMLARREEGHCSMFSTSQSVDSHTVSAYSQREIDDKMRRLGDRQDLYDSNLLYNVKGKVHSYDTGIDYDSAFDYVYSAENYFNKEREKDQLANSLYTTHQTTTVYAQSRSIHYDGLFAVAEYRILPNGTLEHLGILNFKLCGSRGNVPDEIHQRYAEKDAAVVCAGYLADCPALINVPMKLFGRNLLEGAATFSEAIRLAEVYTCLVHKIDISE